MQLTMHKVFKILAPAGSLRRRVALSLAVVRLILAPVLFLSVYYLIKMDSILDRVLNVDATMGTLAQRASIEILQARRAERSYLLLHNPANLHRSVPSAENEFHHAFTKQLVERRGSHSEI